MRHTAALQYVTSRQGISIRELAKTVPFNQLYPATLERWSAEDNWVQRRQKYFQEIRGEIETRIAEKLIQTRVKQLESMDMLFETLMVDITTTNAKTKEGIVTAAVRVLEASDTIRDKLSKEVVPEHLGGVHREGMPVTPTLTDVEARAAAKAVIQKRREQARAGMAEGPEEEQPEKVQLRVVKDETNGKT